MCRPCQEKSSSQPKRQMPQPTQVLKCLHLQPVLWRQADACEGFCWSLTRDNEAGSGGCPRRVGEGVSHCGGHVCAYPWDAFTEVTQEGGSEAEFLGLLQVVVPKLFWPWPSSAKQKTLWPTKPTHFHFPLGENMVITKDERGREK